MKASTPKAASRPRPQIAADEFLKVDLDGYAPFAEHVFKGGHGRLRLTALRDTIDNVLKEPTDGEVRQ